MTRTTRMFVIALFTLTAGLLTQAVSASTGTYTAGVFATPADLGLTPSTPILQAVDLAGASPVTVNGVTFSASTGQFLTASGAWANIFTLLAPTFSDPDLNTLATPFTYTTSGALSGTITGLTIGQKYRLQFITYDGDTGNNNPSYRGQTTVAVAGDPTPLTTYSTEAVLGGFSSSQGVYLDYDFVASAASLSVSLTPNSGSTVLTAFDVQLLPEPASLGLLAVGSVGLLRRRRRA